jgi:hypothetical protein
VGDEIRVAGYRRDSCSLALVSAASGVAYPLLLIDAVDPLAQWRAA